MLPGLRSKHWLALVGSRLICGRVRLPGVLAFVTTVIICFCCSLRFQPRTWKASEIPIAFWSWRSDSPTQASVQRVIDRVGARTIFVRAGQIDCERSTIRRIRPVVSALPQGIELHLVYNATGDLLTKFEEVDPHLLASIICDSYIDDLRRAEDDGAQVAGIQLDMDVATRLLPKYESLLRMLRDRLPLGSRLSITGLPTWMSSPALARTVDAVDFWIPQFYGATIPDRLDRATPISSPGAVAYAVDQARDLGRPFYAGLAAYGYAIHFDRNGKRIQVSGSLDPDLVAGSESLELIDDGPFYSRDSNQAKMQGPGDSRCVYRARENCRVGGLLVREGECILLDLTTAEVLRASARGVRERAGERLLGICIFRLPDLSDPTTLTIEEIAAALSDAAPGVATVLNATLLSGRGDRGAEVQLNCSNAGEARGLPGKEAMSLYVRVAGLRSVRRTGFDSAELFFTPSSAGGDDHPDALIPCGVGRANVVRLVKRHWIPGSRTSAILEFMGPAPDLLSIQLIQPTGDRSSGSKSLELKVERP
jgi:hypothetical protein